MTIQRNLLPVFLIIFIWMCGEIASADTLFVDQSVVGGSNDGSTWANAYNTAIALQDALDVAVSGDQIWVAAGTYYPSTDYGLGIDSRGNHFEMINGVAIYGGFVGTETNLDQRDIEANETILSGDIGTPGDETDNCYHVFYHDDYYNGITLDSTAVLDGFTITAGNADDVDIPHDSGGGMYNYVCSPTVTNCTFIDNTGYYGGGIYNDSCDALVSDCTFSGNSATYGSGMHNYYGAPTVTNCIFSDNTGATNGGGLYNDSSTSIITDCTFETNDADYGGGIYNIFSDFNVTNCIFLINTADFGGGIYFDESLNPTVTNCVFIRNATAAEGYGGGMANEYGSSPSVINCTFSGNTAGYGGGMENYSDSDPLVSNCIFWGNMADLDGLEIYNEDASIPLITYSDISGSGGSGAGWDILLGTDVGGNIDSDPMFVDADNDDFHLMSYGWRWDTNANGWTWDAVTSRCIDAGNPGSSLADEALTLDVDPLNRFGENIRINMGAYGGTAEASMPPYEWALLSDVNNDGISNLPDFAELTARWLASGDDLPCDFDRDNAVNIEDLVLLSEDFLKQTLWHE